jgi:hypothetical protein
LVLTHSGGLSDSNHLVFSTRVGQRLGLPIKNYKEITPGKDTARLVRETINQFFPISYYHVFGEKVYRFCLKYFQRTYDKGGEIFCDIFPDKCPVDNFGGKMQEPERVWEAEV